MSEPAKGATIGSLYSAVLREVRAGPVQELDPGTYGGIAELLGGLRRQEFDGAEARVMAALIDMASDLAEALMRMRLEKARAAAAASAPGPPPGAHSNLLDEEKYVLDSEEEGREREDAVVSAMLRGKSRLLESVCEGHRARTVTVLFLRDTEEFVGADLEKYGPFRAEDLATVPYDDARSLVSQEAAARVRTEG